LLNDLAVKHHLPYIYAGAVGTGGLVMPVLPRGCSGELDIAWTDALATPCLRCVFPEPPPAGSTPTCDTAGVLGPTIYAVTANQAAIALSILVGRMEGFDRSLHSIDPWEGEDRRLQPGTPRTDCPCCGLGVFEWLEQGRGGELASLCGRDTVQLLPSTPAPIDLAALAGRLSSHGTVRHDEHALRVALARERITITVFADGRALVGVGDPIAARILFDRYIGS
jgi:adenylyltransferase/sulfurtransferase